MTFRFLSSGESHGISLNAIIEGVPAGFKIKNDFIDSELARRQVGYGRGARMSIEKDKASILSGVRFGISTGSPICLEIKNKDFENWKIPMSTLEVEQTEENISLINEKTITKIRPGHADFAGAIKYNHTDIRNVLERSSARETATRVAVGAVAKLILKEFGIDAFSYVTQIGDVKIDENIQVDKEIIESSDLRCPDEAAAELMRAEIDKAKENGDTLGGSIRVVLKNVPIGLGSFVHWDRKLDGLLAQALMSIQAVKAVEFGLGNGCALQFGSETHDEIFYNEDGFYRNTNNAGGIEGGMTNGEDIVINITMKAIPTMKKPLQSVDLITKESYQAHFERSDTCAVPACGVVAESMAAVVILNSFLEKFGSDNYNEIKSNFENYKKYLAER